MFGGAFNDIAFNTGDSGPNYVDLSAELSGSGRMYSRRIEVPGADDGRFGSIALNQSEEAKEYEYILEFAMTTSLAADLSGEGSMTADFVRDIRLDAEFMSGQGQASADFVRDRRLEAEKMSGEGRLEAAALRFHIDYVAFTGNFNPGDRLVIDTEEMTVSINGQNALHLMEGDFLELIRGINTLTYTDSESVRSVLARVTHRDKYLY